MLRIKIVTVEISYKRRNVFDKSERSYSIETVYTWDVLLLD